ncbi:hypothetical protein QN355_06490 [Cryobacterium sp. 10S3]|uniref:hypothetical protein n=1 Tax=Cryobacterium sp. 10S3 TaxID=3048582 RepID=UPI002AC8AF51|nr:hypothetical protein [Cryobacterium sp. 10S3]MEB0286197.1 hypothetical protein [Cryobacterium sp. 10S3]WPX12255.1 hypothetical protein RHM57_11230 [Cryobacterium sp. 10S3]
MDLWGISGIVVAIFTAVYLALQFHRQFPKRSLVYEFTSSPLAGALSNAVQVTVSGYITTDPYLASLTVTSRSRADITSASFDSGRDLVFDFGTPILVDPTFGGEMTSHVSGSEVRFAPQLIRRRATSTTLFITHGRPGVVLHNPLVDISVKAATVPRFDPSWSSILSMMTMIMACGAMLVALMARLLR